MVDFMENVIEVCVVHDCIFRPRLFHNVYDTCCYDPGVVGRDSMPMAAAWINDIFSKNLKYNFL